MQIASKVVKIMHAESISPEEMMQMIRLAAKTSVRGFNRRYFTWLFRIHGDHLMDMQREQLTEIGSGLGDTRMLEDHQECNGKGCRECGWVGSVARWIKDKPVPKHQPLHY